MKRQQPKLFEQSQFHDRSIEKVSQAWQAGESSSTLELQLCGEQMLNRLGCRLNQCVTSFLASGIETTAEHLIQSYTEAKEQVFHILMAELQPLVQGRPIAIAMPTANPQNSNYQNSVDATRGQINALNCASNDLWQLSSSEIDTIQLISEQRLQALQSQPSIQTWPIQECQMCFAWLLIDSNLEDHPQLEDSDVLETEVNLPPWLTSVINKSVQCCVQILNQLDLIQSRRQQHQIAVSKNRELENANHLKSQFLANTSHEIRTPLSSILGFTHLLLQQGYHSANLRHQEYLKIILSSGQHLLALINDILDLSKIEANQLTLQYEELEVAEVCKVAIALVKEKASDKGLDLRFEIAPTVSTVKADGLRLKQMLFNLLSNAVKFTVKGCVGLQVAVVDGYARFTVWDTGTGISQDQQTLLFKPYSQIANSAVAWGEGTGLGLVLTQKLAELHGGWVELISEVDQGSSFTIVLPIITSQNSSNVMEQSITSIEEETTSIETAVAAKRIQEPETDPLLCRPLLEQDFQSALQTATPESGVRPNGILLVEDNYYNAKLMLTYLNHLGYEVTWAKNGFEMCQALERSLPAVILMDINLPDVDGITLIQQLKQDDRYLMIPVVAQTAMAMKGDRDRCLAAGAEGYISKPIDLDALAQIVFKYANCWVD